MKNKNLVYSLITTVAFILMFCPLGSMAATYDGAWEPSDSIIYFIDLTFPSGSGSLYMYDYDEGTDDDLWVLNDGGISQAIIYVHQGSGGDWYAGYTANGEQLNLGDDNYFGFYFGDGTDTYESYQVTVLGPAEYYLLNDDLGDSMKVHVLGASMVPIPSSLLLFGSALIGLAGVRRGFFS